MTKMIGAKAKRMTETYLLDKELFSEAEQTVNVILNSEMDLGTVSEYEILSLKQSSIKELVNPQDLEAMNEPFSYVVNLKCSYTDPDSGEEKSSKYQILLWADDIAKAQKKAAEFLRQGYDMTVEGIKQVNYTLVK